MSTLKREDYNVMKQQIADSNGILVSKEKVLRILHDKLQEVDAKNELIIDKIDGAAVKELINSIAKLGHDEGK